MDKKTFWIIAGIAIAVLILLAIWQTVAISSISAGEVATAGQAGQQATSSGGMVGGC